MIEESKVLEMESLIEEEKLDKGIRDFVLFLRENNFETFESCQGGIGHGFPEPTVRFFGNKHEGLRMAMICIKNDLPIDEVRRSFSIDEGELQTPFWEVTFRPLNKISLQLSLIHI